MSKLATLLLFALLVSSSLVMTGSVLAQTIPTPSVANFTLEFDNQIRLLLKIENQALASYNDGVNQFYYSIRFKVDSDEVRKYWTTLYFAEAEKDWKTPSESEYTIIPVGYFGVDSYNQDSFIVSTHEEQKIYISYPNQVDFQVEALIGYVAPASAPPVFVWKLVGETSGWSETQTISVPATPLSLIPEPSVPEFTLDYVDNSYDVPTTYTVDPHTGENVTHQGYHVDKATLVMTIQNQPLVYQYSGGSFGTVNFYYNVQVKGHYEEEWFQFFRNDELPIANVSSTETSLTLGVLGGAGLSLYSRSEEIVPFGGEEDFQVQAMIGYFHKVAVPLSGWFFEGETSDWSNTQTLTIEELPTPTPSPEPTPMPHEVPQPTELEVILGVAVTVAVIGAGLVLLLYKIKRK